ncbi:MAG: DUF1786 domain-containing protein [Archaeoglobi archaeon]|nr:DUF1786 domain-containing protein [Candidatus Mnemosynella bozhongmuii]
MEVLALDVGTGTTDVLLYEEGREIENCVKLILPSATRVLAEKIRKATRNRQDVFLYGHVMGGGPILQAVREHIESGLKVYATEESAKTLHDNLEKVRELGVIITENSDAIALKTGDIPLDELREFLRNFEVELPESIAVAVQDHGFSPFESNRVFRFRWMREMLQKDNFLFNLSFEDPPDYLTRMKAVARIAERDFRDCIVMDTGFSALAGASPRSSERTLIINAGNGHTLAGIVEDGYLLGIFEHHTRMVDESYPKMIEKFIKGELRFEEVFSAGGHGALILERAGRVERTLIVGPRREKIRNSGIEGEFPAPYGDMMLTGCFGLVRSFLWRKRGDIPI